MTGIYSYKLLFIRLKCFFVNDRKCIYNFSVDHEFPLNINKKNTFDKFATIVIHPILKLKICQGLLIKNQ